MIQGRLIGVGVGPGDPELLTLKAVRAIREAPVLAYAAAGGQPSLARRIAAVHIPPGRREINVVLPMDPHPELARAAYDEGASRIAAELELGDDVAVLCEGDPFFYGSFIQFFGRLGPNYPCLVVPGVTSISAATAAAGLPLAWRSRTLSIVPATLPPAELERRLEEADAAVVLKVGRHLGTVRDVLAKLDLIGAAVLIERATMPEQRLAPLVDVAAAEAPYMSLILVPGRGGR